ncbi:hypothetical protein LLS47_02185 [Rouxiella badensis]|jgi:secreted effector protein SseD|nr:hypothetical protein [Rouxiella badensis]MCC3718263.1 hypothetical protein [Rouxiella badensis]MCC3726969.1 hypothetical protein [Rouxiella badensis]MCC3731747.1 hypothetical protein [Rouxiella badensis]MCC3738682.1 hypothetical protein [Rouxiella badensis]MCC3746751.1 hypothetical protein [Rouxiella badensis]
MQAPPNLNGIYKMTTINQTNSAPVTSSAETSSTASVVDGQGVIGTLNEVMMMLKKMNNEIRDLQRDFVGSSFKNAFNKEMSSLELKKEAIDTDYKAAMTNATVKMVTGSISAAFGVAGGFAAGSKLADAVKTGSETFNGVGKAFESGMSMKAAGITRDARKIELRADMQQAQAAQIRQTISAAADKATEASRRMLEMTGELTRLQSAILDKVRM